MAIETHPTIYRPPTPLADAMTQVEYWMESPSLRLLGETTAVDGLRYWEHLRALAEPPQIKGPEIHDARIAAICRASGVRELWSADRDFSRMAGLLVRNPLR